jgi:hypothetical protein
MPRAVLVTVPDEGAAEMVRAALAEAGITPEIERAYLDHPYGATALAEPWKIYVPGERLKDAQDALARLEHDVSEEVEAQATAWDGPRADADPHAPLPDAGARPPKISWALALAAVVPFPVVCFYARSRRLGAILLGLFVAIIGMSFAQGVWSFGVGVPDHYTVGADYHEPEDHERPLEDVRYGGVPIKPRALSRGERVFLALIAAKAADLAAGVAIIALRRRRARGLAAPPAAAA